ncbi:AAA family ATPase [Actinoplanes sp. NPDC049265]|uniref:AAA family ATPase n=1 Tax=Actinoplanes sp. NPDC049265 TaxID=3363902 RepID=UPI003715E56B
MPLMGRHAETRRIDELIGAARTGRGGVLVLRGEAGIGKSALLDHARRSAPGFRIVEASGSEFETELPFAALHQLCVPMLGRLAELPAPHRDALRIAFGLVTGAPDPFRIGLATLELMSAAGGQPLLCVVDDAHWLDAASSRALAFLARRVSAEPVAMLFAVREAGVLDELPGLPVGGLSDADARALLTVDGPLDEQVRERIVAEARGNPLGLLELPRAGGFASPGPAVPTRIERGFQARLDGQPDDVRLLLTLAGADPTGNPGLLWPAARRLGLDGPATSRAATATGLVEFATRVRFCHPLARSAVYRAATVDDRQAVHRALAEVTDPIADPDRRAWHRAEAVGGPDDDVAADLARSAHRAQSRGGMAAAAAFFERAAALSLDAGPRFEHTVAAAQAHLDAGRAETAAGLLTTVEDSALTEVQRARVELLRGRIAFVRRGDNDGPAFMLRAAQRLAPIDPNWSRTTFLDALEMSLAVGRAAGLMDVVLAAAPATGDGDVLDALSLLAKEGHRTIAPLLREVLHTPLWTTRPALAVMLAGELWDPHAYASIVDWLLTTGREQGSPFVLGLGLAQLTSLSVLTGDLGRAIAAIAEEEAIADAIGAPPKLYPRLQLAALRGRRDEALALFRTATAAATEHGAGQLIANVHLSAAILHNGLGDYPAALAAARQAAEPGDLSLAGFALPELVEAAVRSGKPTAARTALAALTERADGSGTNTGLGVAAYARGLVTGREEDYREAVDRLTDSPLVPYRARAHLLYGEWLRREGRRRDCRPQLRTAHELMSASGMEAFTRRAASELRATGETARSRTGHTYDQLTMQEMSIARLVATGATSNEVAARLFLSPRTVDAHLRNIFRKLGITSRRQLRDQPDLGG